MLLRGSRRGLLNLGSLLTSVVSNISRLCRITYPVDGICYVMRCCLAPRGPPVVKNTNGRRLPPGASGVLWDVLYGLSRVSPAQRLELGHFDGKTEKKPSKRGPEATQ